MELQELQELQEQLPLLLLQVLGAKEAELLLLLQKL
jgi:hypothetical protein